VLEQAAAQGHRRRRVRLAQAGLVLAAALPAELRPGALEREEQHLDLAGRHRWFVDRGVQIDVLVMRRTLDHVPDVPLLD
jgi:hypothetical protein